MEERFNFTVSRADTFPNVDEHSYFPYHDKYVIHYDFEGVDDETAIEDIQQICDSLDKIGLQTEVRAGEDQSLLIFVRAGNEVLNTEIYKSRVKDWLYGITKSQPRVDKRSKSEVIQTAFEAESLLCVYHLINMSPENGGAGIVPGSGKFERVKALFPIQNEPTNRSLLKYLSKKFLLTKDDLDQIRDLFGSKVAFYFAFMQTYLVFLSFPAVTGVLAWAFLPKYSFVYAVVTLLGCTIFLEYWKILQQDLSIRWKVKGVAALKANRPSYRYEKVVVDSAGRTKHYYPKWKSFVRQSLQIPFFFLCLMALGTIITMVFALEVLISEVYRGPYKWYLEFLPTIVLAAALPYLNSFLEDAATWLADFENHRTKDYHEMSVTQKLFLLSFIVNYLPILLTAFVYVPLGNTIVPWLGAQLPGTLGSTLDRNFFQRDPDRLRNEVIALTLTGQLSDMFEEMVVPFIMHRVKSWYHAFKAYRSHQASFNALSPDDPTEKSFLRRVRRQATLPEYNVQDDISEMVIQFGYLALFSPVWPLVSVGFFINNWIELRSDFLKICIEHQRPHPVRTDGIGPWIDSLDALAWLGSISTAAIVHMFGTAAAKSNATATTTTGTTTDPDPTDTAISSWFGQTNWWSLLITIFVSEHIFLLLRSVVRMVLQRVGSQEVRRERNESYIRRKRYLAELESASRAREMLDVGAVQRRKSVRLADTDIFWTQQVEQGASVEAGIALVKALGRAKDSSYKKNK